MLLQSFSIFDSKAAAFITPFHSPTIATAIRSFATACNEETSDFYKYSGDYTLFHLGEFDQDKGHYNILPAPVNLGLASTYIVPTPSPVQLHEAKS